MAEKSPKGAKGAADAALGMPALMNGAFGEAMAQYGETCAESLTALQKEIAGFTEDRLASNRALAEQLSRCRDWNDLVRLQQDWARDTSEAYLKESTRVVQLFTELSRAWLGPMGTLLQTGPDALRTAPNPAKQGGSDRS